jgi:phage-related tail fiber protein
MADYYAILTNTGKALEAAAIANGTKITLIKFVVGDGNGQAQIPDPARTALVHEVYRNSISDLTVSIDQPNQIIAQLVMPANVGGFTVREIGLLTDKGELYAIANCATFDKPVNGVSITMQFRLAVSETENVTLDVATGEGLFLRCDQNLADVKDPERARANIAVFSRIESDGRYLKNLAIQ